LQSGVFYGIPVGCIEEILLPKGFFVLHIRGNKDNACRKCKLPSMFLNFFVIVPCTFLQSV
jgi:hypothetical protein